MGLILSFRRNKQNSADPEIVMVEHEGETIFIKPFIAENGHIRLNFEGPRSFDIKRIGFKDGDTECAN